MRLEELFEGEVVQFPKKNIANQAQDKIFSYREDQKYLDDRVEQIIRDSSKKLYDTVMQLAPLFRIYEKDTDIISLLCYELTSKENEKFHELITSYYHRNKPKIWQIMKERKDDLHALQQEAFLLGEKYGPGVINLSHINYAIMTLIDASKEFKKLG